MSRVPNTSPHTLKLLATLLESRKTWRHGYDLSQECDLKSGTLYPLLMRLSDQGLLESQWETDGDNRRPRHLYRLSTEGVSAAKSLIRTASIKPQPARGTA
jgi:PadR family transcriptional regulator, regulatory protein PadR